jgi:LruC domain-containing protein
MKIIMKMIQQAKTWTTVMIFAMISFSSATSFAQLKSVCDIYKAMGGGYSSTITSVVCNQSDHSHTITLTIQNDGCSDPGCKAITSYAVQAAAGTYSNVSVSVIYGGIYYASINMGPVLSGEAFTGFRIEGIGGIGNGHVGVFKVTYTLTGLLQDQQIAAHGSSSSFNTNFLNQDFQNVMTCYYTDCSGGGLVGPTANNDNATTTLNTPVNINILTNDLPGSGALVPSSVIFVAGTEPPLTTGIFTKNSSGVVTFTPATGFTGTATIHYTVCDINSLCSSAIIMVIVSSSSGCPGDQDCDGCTDNVDDYPADPTRCFNNYYPASGNGTLAYEDLWPSRGDYDMNDVVVDYRFNTITDHNNNVVEIFGTFVLKASGAYFHNGFGFQIPTVNVDPANITVTGYNLSHSFISLNGHGLENGQTKPTIIVFDDFLGLMPNPGCGTGVNTTEGCAYVSPVTITIHITFSSPVYQMSQTNIENFNPFIFVNEVRDHEVHLPDYLPTSLANPAFFNTFDDNTIPSANKYYKSSNNLPWAINIYEGFDYPKEKVDIINTYLHFKDWVTSGGMLYPDWYQDKPGYRNTSNIYTH